MASSHVVCGPVMASSRTNSNSPLRTAKLTALNSDTTPDTTPVATSPTNVPSLQSGVPLRASVTTCLRPGADSTLDGVILHWLEAPAI